MTGGAAETTAAPEPAWTRWLPLLLLPVSVLPDPWAVLPLRSYFFRDFTVTFLPLRIFGARELAEGRFPFWNPYLSEGAVHLPVFYPPDLAHALWPSPVFVSWLLTLHLPLAALAGYWLARQLGVGRIAAFGAGVVFSLCGFALSCLNLYVFLQALALAPFVVGLLRRAALGGSRSTVAAAAVLGLAVSTLAVEFVAQAVLLGLALSWADAGLRGAARATAAAILGLGLAGLPIALLLGLLPETPRGGGLDASMALANAVHPVVFLQTMLPHLFGFPESPAEAWWGARFFTKGTPYFLTLYCGPVVLALAGLGLTAVARRRAIALAGLALLAVWFSTGTAGGLAPIVRLLPMGEAFRFPSKALLLPHLVLALGAGLGLQSAFEAPRRWLGLAAATAGLAASCVLVAAAIPWAPTGWAAWAGLSETGWVVVGRVAMQDAALAVVVALGTALICGVGWRRAGGGTLASCLLVALVAADLARAGAGLNRQIGADVHELSPEVSRLLEGASDRGRVFSYGVDRSPAFARYLASAAPERTLGAFVAYRQVLGPFSNVIDRLEAAETKDLTAFAPREPEIDPRLLDPENAEALVSWWRNAGVATVISLDELPAPELRLLGAVPAGPPGLQVHAYALEGTRPRGQIACRVVVAADRLEALRAPFAPDFDADRDVALPLALPARCSAGTARPLARRSGGSAWETETEGDGLLVVRESWSRGWTARLDGRIAPVYPANGKHLAVPVPSGRHRVGLSYEPPGLRMGAGVTAVAMMLAAGLLLRRRP